MKNAVLYARVSSAVQEKEGTIESQISELRKQIEKDGNELAGEYVDNGYSGALLSRPAMDQLRKDLKSGTFDAIYFHAADRIARDVTYQNIIIGEILRHGKKIVIGGQDYVQNPENKFTLTVLGAVSELERAKIIERSMRGRQHYLRQGILLGQGNRIYGYAYTRRNRSLGSFPSYIINEKEAKTVRYIFKIYAQGNIGFKSLAKRLQEENIPVREGRKSWCGTALKYILQNETYTGTKYFNTMTDTSALGRQEHKTRRGKKVMRERSEWIGIKIPAIISKELFDRVRERIRCNRECYRHAKRTQLLSNLVICGSCGTRCYALRRYYKVERKGGARICQRASYVCGSKSKEAHNPEINAEILESYVFGLMKSAMFDPAGLRKRLELQRKESEAGSLGSGKKLKDIRAKMKVIDSQKKRILDLYSLGDLGREAYVERTNAYERDLEALRERKNELNNRLPIISEPEEMEKNINRFSSAAKERWEQCLGFEAKRQFLLDYVERAEYRLEDGYYRVKLCLALPLGMEANRAKITAEGRINRAEALAELRRKNSEDGLAYGNRLTSREYGKLAARNIPPVP